MVSTPVTVPFFDPAMTLTLPPDLEALLVEAIQARVSAAMNSNVSVS